MEITGGKIYSFSIHIAQIVSTPAVRPKKLSRDIAKVKTIEPSARQAAGNVLPETAVLHSTGRKKSDFQFAR